MNTSPILRSNKTRGFALVIALGLMAFVLLLLLTITTMVQVESQSAQSQMQQLEAEQAALLSLNIALGKLQEVAGPDQRITAAASIFGDSQNGHESENPDGSTTTAASVTPAAGQGAWVGVWKSDTVAVGTPSYSPAIPNERLFLGWLVSSANDATGQLELPQEMGEVGRDVSSSSNYVELATDSNGDAYMQVQKVTVVDSDTAFAFSIEDESLKVDLSWSEHSKSTTSPERYQAGRLAAAPGPDYGALNGSSVTGPFASVTYPLSSDSTTLISDGILKLSDVADITSIMSSGTDAAAWLKDSRGDVTWGSRGVMADVKFGGLRRDLSLAFEMDGDAEVSVSEQPTKFNQQVGEFVGGSDRLTADHSGANVLPVGMPIKERFLWRDIYGSGTPFAGDIEDELGSGLSLHKPVLRGPNWWALRDYANLYKRLSGSNGDYTMPARASYPNRSSETLALSDYYTDASWQGDGFDREHSNPRLLGEEFTTIGTRPPDSNDYYIYRPAGSNYAPVSLGTSTLVSLRATPISDTQANLEVVLDPLFYFWNPYNRKIKFESIAVVLGAGFEGNVKMWVNDGTAETTTTSALADLLKANLSNKNGQKIIFQIEGPIVLEPGEVVIASPTDVDGEAVLGYATDKDSGIILEKSKDTEAAEKRSNIVPFTVNLTDTVGVNLMEGRGDVMSSRHQVDISLPSKDVDVAGIVGDLEMLGEQIHNVWVPMWAGVKGMADYTNAAAAKDAPVRTVAVADLVNTKLIFGAQCLLIKPASAGGEVANPYEMFSRFNPVASIIKREMWANCSYTQISRLIAANSDFAVREEAGIDFSGDPRGTFYGLSYQNTGSKFVPLTDIPSSPLISLAAFANANLSIMDADPYHAVGNSWSSPLLEPKSAYAKGKVSAASVIVQDYSWLINDALFDRYYLSGIAPEFSIGGSGYSAGGKTLEDTLDKFFDNDADPTTNYRDALANPVLRPYLPSGVTASDVVTALAADDGYKKMGAYSLIDGAFNVNSTSVSAWKAFLRANRNLDVDYADGGSDSADGVPFPSGPSPSDAGNRATPEWSGFSRLTDDQITGLAEQIVEQVKLRGPFMSISDFVNHRMQDPVDSNTCYTGALQAALDLEAAPGGSGINAGSRAAAINSAAVDSNSQTGTPVYPIANFDPNIPVGKTTTGIPGSITQADLLLPLAPRLTARADTFRIRSYGEVRSIDGTEVLSHAICEAVVQRIPEYIDPVTNAGDNEPWDEAMDPITLVESSNFNDLNKKFGRRFKIVQFRWLAANEL